MPAYYNEHDPYAAQWLRNLIRAGHIAPGDVDERSIEDVYPSDLDGYTQCHFFAGVGVWSYALRLSGWPDDRPVWTGSCPCQPFSAAGKGLGFADERHLWPAWYHLIGQREPGVVFGEQVASKDGLAWLDLVHTDMEAATYAFGALDTCAAGVGAPHIRQRLYWVADSGSAGLSEQWRGRDESERFTAGVVARGLADAERPSIRGGGPGPTGATQAGVQGSHRERQRVRADDMAGRSVMDVAQQTRPTNGHWRDADWLFCRDGKFRPVEPGTFPLAHGAPSRVGRLRAYGNAINAHQAAEFIRAYLGGPR